jgi:hypothetical protein
LMGASGAATAQEAKAEEAKVRKAAAAQAQAEQEAALASERQRLKREQEQANDWVARAVQAKQATAAAGGEPSGYAILMMRRARRLAGTAPQ